MKDSFQDRALGIKVAICLLLLYALWGGNTVAIKVSLKGLPPLAVFTLRSLISLIIFCFWNRARAITFTARGRELRLMIAYSFIAGAAMALFIVGLKYTSASRAALFVNSYPLFTIFVAHYFLVGHQLNWQKVVGSIIAFAGLAIVFLGRESQARGFAIGDIIITASAVCLAVRIVLTKKLVRDIEPAKILLWSSGVPIPFMAAASLIFEGQPSLNLPPVAIAGILYQGIILGFFCFLVRATLLKYYSATTLASFVSLIPIYGVFYSITLLGEPLTLAIVLGAALVAIGIFSVNYTPGTVKGND